MTLDHDGKIRMDCSSPYAMAGLGEPQRSLSSCRRQRRRRRPPRHRHAVARADESQSLSRRGDSLFAHAPAAVEERRCRRQNSGEQLAHRSSGREARIESFSKFPSASNGFRQGLFDGDLCFGGEESAGASFLCRDGTVWTTDKDGIILSLLAAEIIATTGRDPGAGTMN